MATAYVEHGRRSGRTMRALAALPDGSIYLIHNMVLAQHCRNLLRAMGRRPNAIRFVAGRSNFQRLEGFPDTLLGNEICINQDMPVMAANAKSILYGDFSPYIIRDVMALTLLRFDDSAYAKKGQVGFLMLSRHGGNFTDVGGAVKFYQNSAT